MGEAENADVRREAILDKIRSEDYTGARTLLLDALKSFPSLENASEILTLCEVLCSSEVVRPGCSVDWYWLLQVFPMDDTSIVDAQYNKIVAQLEPVEHDLPGTSSALELVRNAYTVLSDPAKRAAFDAKRNRVYIGTKSMAENTEQAKENIPLGKAETRAEFSNHADGKERFEKQSTGILTDAPGSSASKREASETCGDNGELEPVLEDYAHKKQKRIYTEDAAWDSTRVTPTNKFRTQEEVEGENCCSSALHDFHDFDYDRKIELFAAGQVWIGYDEEGIPRRYAQINKIVPDSLQLYVSWFRPRPESLLEKRWSNGGLPATCGTFVLEDSKITPSEPENFSQLLRGDTPKKHLEVYPIRGEVWAIYRELDIDLATRKNNRVLWLVETMSDYSNDSGIKVACLMKVDKYKNIFQRFRKDGLVFSFDIPASNLFMFSHMIPAFRFHGGEMEGIVNGMLELDPHAVPANLGRDFSCVPATQGLSEEVNCSDQADAAQLSNPATSTTDSGSSISKLQSSSRNKLSLKDFWEEQIWAVYDDHLEGMPRSYVRVNNVGSSNEVCITHLEPHPMLNEEIQWVEENLPVSCGIFRAGRDTSNLDISRFSHPVNCDRSAKKSFYRIFPKKGEIWAMYKNWTLSWKRSDISRCQCHMVEILSDYSDENGINICCLTEVNGCLTFFQRQLYDGFQLTRSLSRLEMLSFSHRVPAFIVVGIKERDIPKGSWHLEPNALPPKPL